MRIRAHHNPFAITQDYQTLDLDAVFRDPTLPLVLEIGCASGGFMLQYCAQNPGVNYVGLEIRYPLVKHVEKLIKQQQLPNAFVLHANANITMKQLFSANQIEKVFIFFPDPWKKRKHQKRNLVNKAFLDDLFVVTRPGTEVYVQSDVDTLINNIKMHFEKHDGYENTCGPNGWLPQRHIDIVTEREGFCLEDNKPIYRLLYKRKA